MVGKFFSLIIYKIYKYSRNYLLKHNNLVYKEDFDYFFWGDGL